MFTPKFHSETANTLTNNRLRVLEARYLRRDATGAVIETPRQMFERVAHLQRAVSSIICLECKNWTSSGQHRNKPGLVRWATMAIPGPEVGF